MLQSFSAENFRCFKSLTVEPLARINLIGGKNNVGKTSFLEALFLHYGPPSHSRHLMDFLRTLEHFSIGRGEFWEWLFRNKKPDSTIRLKSSGDNGLTRELTIRLVEPDTIALPKEVPGTGTAELPGRYELRLNYAEKDETGDTQQEFVLSPSGTASRTKSTSKSPIPSAPWMYLGASALQDPDDAERFGQLEKIGREREIVATLQLLEPRISRLALIVSAGVPILHGEIGIGHMIPVRLMGEGIRRLLSIALAIANCSGGICLIDEIENGLHYSVMKDVWKAVACAARKTDVQLFATTHSWECLVKCHEAFADDETYDFRWHRLQNVRGEVQAVSHDREMIEAAIYSGVEIR
jgi:hypothetical protein